MNSKEMLLISILTLITVAAWIAFEVYHTAASSTITEVQQKLITPLKSDFDGGVLENIRLRRQ